MKSEIKPSFLESAMLQELTVRKGILKLVEVAGMLTMGEPLQDPALADAML